MKSECMRSDSHTLERHKTVDILKKVARSVRGYNTEGSLQAFYGAIAARNQNGGPQYRESKRDFEAIRTNRYMGF